MPHKLERQLFVLCCILSAAPLLLSHYPPMIDVPQHAAQIATLNNLSNPDFSYKDLYFLEWKRPYLGGYMVLWALSKLFPILTALKVLLAITVITIPLCASRLRAHFHGNPAWDWLLLPISYGFAFQWGFFNFIVGVPIVLLFLLSAFRFADAPTRRGGIWLALFANTLLFIHLLVAAFSCGLACIFIVAGHNRLKQKLLVMLPCISIVPTVVVYMFGWVTSSQQAIEKGPWGLGLYRFSEIPACAVGLTPNNPLHAVFGVAILALPFLLGARFSRDRRRLAVFATYLAWMLFGPNYIWGNYFTYNRFSLFFIPMLLLALEQAPAHSALTENFRKALHAISVLAPVCVLLILSIEFASFDLETRSFQETTAAMEPGKRTLGLIVDKQSRSFGGMPMYIHYASWYQAEHDGVADFSFSLFGLLVSYKPEADIPVHRGFEWRADTFDWERNKGWLYDYFIVRLPQDASDYFFAKADCPVTLVAHHDEWWLYQTQTGSPDDPHSCAARRLHEKAAR